MRLNSFKLSTNSTSLPYPQAINQTGKDLKRISGTSSIVVEPEKLQVSNIVILIYCAQ